MLQFFYKSPVVVMGLRVEFQVSFSACPLGVYQGLACLVKRWVRALQVSFQGRTEKLSWG